MKVTLIVFAVVCSSTLAVGPGFLGLGFNGGLGLTRRHGFNMGFGLNRFDVGGVGNGYVGYHNVYGKRRGSNYNGYNGLNGHGLLGNGHGHSNCGYSGFNSLLGLGFGKFGGVYH